MKRLLVRGRVQRVGFRHFTASAARDLGLAGSVCNLDDGVVLVKVAGSPANVEAFVAILRRGPPFARVDDVVEQTLEGEDLKEPFCVVSSGDAQH